MGRIAGEGFGLSWGDFELLWIRGGFGLWWGGRVRVSWGRIQGSRLRIRGKKIGFYVGVFRGEDLGFGGEEGGFRGRNV